MFFSYDHLQLRYEPFPIGAARPLMSEATYREFLANFPPAELFAGYRDLGKPGDKFTLSKKESPETYRDFVSANPLWREFQRWVESDDFVYGVFDALRERHVDLGHRRLSASQRLRKGLKDLRRLRLPRGAERLKARFEFSMLPADDGHIIPHTDAPSKVATLIVSMVGEGEWDPAFGGGTDVNRPRDVRLAFNRVNALADFDDMEVVHTYDFVPNQGILFVKTHNSWHSVRPMKGAGTKAMRKTLTIAIESLRDR